jgi:hypothetical protein
MRLHDDALAALAVFASDADPLRAIAAEIVKRDH